MNLAFISLAPVVIFAVYIYIRDKYEHEPIGLLILSLLVGALITIPIIYLERFISQFMTSFSSNIGAAAFRAFALAAFSEEIFKYFGFFLLIWGNKHFNEKFDGIVYAVFISLGFAAVENVLYVTSYGYDVGIVRAITAVPAHALDGVAMGYFFGLAKFYPLKRKTYLCYAFLMPFILHGIYDFILMAEFKFMWFLFIPFILLLWYYGLKLMKTLSEQSVYRNDGIGNQDSNIFGL